MLDEMSFLKINIPTVTSLHGKELEVLFVCTLQWYYTILGDRLVLVSSGVMDLVYQCVC